jgi:catechol 2,3-dioxygenase-like lactoylglutathione lyase family enzyme
MSHDVPMRLTFVTLGCRDIAKMRAFYTGLGWTASGDAPDGFMAFQTGGVMLALYPLDSLAAEAAPKADAPAGGWNGVTLASNVTSASEVDTVFAAWVARGATPITEPFDLEWGGRTAYVADPEGNRWEIAWNSAIVFDERGGVLRWE